MKTWEELSPEAREWMLDLGHFSPTRRPGELKGYMRDRDGDNCKTYFTAADLEGLAAAATEVAARLRESAP